MINKIAFCGLSHLGLVYSSVYSKFSKKTICFDNDKNLINKLKKGELPINEPGINKEIKRNKKKIYYTNSISDLYKSDLIFISLDVPTGSNGKSNYNKILKILKIFQDPKFKYSTIILLSQLYPGFCLKINKKIKNKIFYQVETLVFGEAIKRAKKPERLIIGSENKKINDTKYLRLIKKLKCPIISMDFVSAEVTKISINILLISTAMTSNFLSSIGEKVGFDWDMITKSLQYDKRIGKYAYLKPSLGLAGGNLERDLNTLKVLCKKIKVNSSLISSWHKVSNERKLWIKKKLLTLKKYISIKNISILGLSYKENTNSIKNSNALLTINSFKKTNFFAYDPVVEQNQIKDYKNIRLLSIEKCLKSSKIIIIASPWREFLVFLKKNKHLLKNKILIDPHNITVGIKGVKYEKKFSLGRK